MRGVARPYKFLGALFSLFLILPLIAVGLSPFSTSRALAQQQQEDAQPAGQTVNVELILDSSGSMAEQPTPASRGSTPPSAC